MLYVAPTTLILPTKLPDQEVLRSLLLEKLGSSEQKKNEDDKDNNATKDAMHDVYIGLAKDAGESHLMTYASQLAQKEAASVNSDAEKIRDGLEGLAEMLELSTVPSVIEGYDISHSQGANTVASKVVFVDGVPVKSLYKRYKLRTPELADGKVDDYLAIKEVLSRRFADYLSKTSPNSVNNRKNKPNKKRKDNKDKIPDIILIDGGKGQLGVAEEVLNSLNFNGGNSTILISLAKKNEEVFVVGKPEAVNTNYDQSSSPMTILRQVRDEAHRYALSYHRSLQRKTLLLDGGGDMPVKHIEREDADSKSTQYVIT